MTENLKDLIAAMEYERRLFGAELHDTICQTFAGTTLLMESMARAMTAGEAPNPEAFQALQSTIKSGIAQARAISMRFNPLELESGGLMFAVQNLVAENRGSVFVCEAPVFVRDSEAALALFRIAELAARLGDYSKEPVEIALHRDGMKAVMTVSSNAIEHPDHAAAVTLMRLRTEAVGGVAELESGEGKGKVLRCTVPVCELP